MCVCVRLTNTNLHTGNTQTGNWGGENPGFFKESGTGMWGCGFLVLNSKFSSLIWGIIAVFFAAGAFFIFYFFIFIFFVFAAWG